VTDYALERHSLQARERFGVAYGVSAWGGIKRRRD